MQQEQPLAAVFLLSDVAHTQPAGRDPRIAAENAGIGLPDQPIIVVHRSDGSGTTYIWVDYLSKVSPEWQKKVGRGTSVSWPVGLGGKGNEGVSGQVKNTPGALGYVELAYAVKNKLPVASVKNAAGKFVEPKSATFQAAAGNADWANTKGYAVILTNEPGAESWPITGASFILMYKQPQNPQATLEALKFFAWSFNKGDKLAEDLDYVPMPANVVKMVQDTWANSIKDAGGKSLWSGAMTQ